MGIVRTYQCEDCFHRIEVTLRADQWDDPPPQCEACDARKMNQEFTPPRINGSPSARANAIAEKIAGEDFSVSNMNRDHRRGSTPKVAYNDDMMGVPKRQGRSPGQIATPSTWGASHAAVEQAAAYGRDTRIRFGNGLDVLQSALKSGAQPDLIEASKRRSARIW